MTRGKSPSIDFLSFPHKLTDTKVYELKIIYIVPYRRFYANCLFFKWLIFFHRHKCISISATAVCIEMFIKHKAECDMEAEKRGQNVRDRIYVH